MFPKFIQVGLYSEEGVYTEGGKEGGRLIYRMLIGLHIWGAYIRGAYIQGPTY